MRTDMQRKYAAYAAQIRRGKRTKRSRFVRLLQVTPNVIYLKDNRGNEPVNIY